MKLDPHRLAASLREALEKRGKTQSEAAIDCDIDQSQISRLLSGKFRRSSPNLIKLCNYANVALPDKELDSGPPRLNTVLASVRKSFLSLDSNHQRDFALLLDALNSLVVKKGESECRS